MPSSVNLAVIANLILNGNCRACILGDSTTHRNSQASSDSDKTQQSTIYYGFLRNWPANWIGFVSHVNGGRAFSGLQVNYWDADEPSHKSGGDVIAGSSQRCSFPVVQFDFVGNTGSGSPFFRLENKIYAGSELLSDDFRSQQDDVIRSRMIVLQDSSTFDGTANLQTRRDTTVIGTNGINPKGATQWTFVEGGHGSASAGAANVRMLHPAVNEAGTNFYSAGVLFYKQNASTGLQIDSMGVGGAKIANFLSPEVADATPGAGESTGYINDTHLSEYLSITRSPNLFIIHVGRNDGLQVSGATWKENIKRVIERYRHVTVETNGGDEPLFWLQSPYGSDNFPAGGSASTAARVMLEVRDEGTENVPPSRIGFTDGVAVAGNQNLDDALPGAFEPLDTGVGHPSQNGAEHYAGLVWSELQSYDGLLDPTIMREGCLDNGRLASSLTTEPVTGSAKASQLRPGLLGPDGKLKPSMVDEDEYLKPAWRRR